MDSSAYIWANKVAPDAIPVGSLNKGEQFLWPHDPGKRVKTYCGKGWFSVEGMKRKCRTGTKTAVIKIADKKD